MPLIIRKPRDVLLSRSSVTRTARSLSDTVDQLQGQLRAAQQQIGAKRNQHCRSALRTGATGYVRCTRRRAKLERDAALTGRARKPMT
jgi:IMP dehydrogenase/GMP reductase